MSDLLSCLLIILGLLLLLLPVALFVPKFNFWIRVFIAYGALSVCAIYGIIVAILLRTFGYARLTQWATARCFMVATRYALGIRFDISGAEYLKTRPAVFIGNHQSELDISFLGAIFPPYCSVTAKTSLRWIPFLGLFMMLSHTIFIDRKNRSSAVDAFNKAGKEMKTRRQSAFVFPEGTRSYYEHPGLLPFKMGAFHLAIQAQVPIVPVIAANYSHILAPKKRIFKSGVIPVKVLPPISTKGLTPEDVHELADRARELMLQELKRITAEDRASYQQLDANKNGTATATGVDTLKGANGRIKHEL